MTLGVPLNFLLFLAFSTATLVLLAGRAFRKRREKKKEREEREDDEDEKDDEDDRCIQREHCYLLPFTLSCCCCNTCIQFENIKDPPYLLPSVPKYWLEEDGTTSLTEPHRRRSIKTLTWLRTNGLASVPHSIKAELRILVHGSSHFV